jgi:hypothetical protein
VSVSGFGGRRWRPPHLIRGLIIVAILVGLAVVRLALGAPGTTRDRAAGRAAQQGRVLFDGSSFRGSSVAPYARIYSTGPFSTTNPRRHGIVAVRDPTGLPRTVLKLTTDDSQSRGGIVRVQAESHADIARKGDTIWILNEFYNPGIPPVTSWLTLGSLYAGGSTGPGRVSIGVRGDHGRNYLTWTDEGGNSGRTGKPVWRTPFTPGTWQVVARKIHVSDDPNAGWMEIYHAVLGHPLRRQRLLGPWAGRMRRVMATVSSRWPGPFDVRINNYHAAGMPGWSGVHSVYDADHKVFRGSATLRQIDPFSTGPGN